MKMDESNAKSLLIALLGAYIMATGFTDIILLPVFRSSIQLPEFIFFPLFVTWLIVFKRQLPQLLTPTRLDIALLGLIGIYVLSTQVHRDFKNVVETTGIIYLFLVYIIFKTSLAVIDNPERWIIKFFVISGLIAAILGIAGWMLFQFGTQTTFVKVEPHYPYFGELGRATGLTTTPNMLFNLVGICFLLYLPYLLSIARIQARHYVMGAILVSGLVLTFSKSILLLLICVMVIWYLHPKNNFRKQTIIISSALLFIVCMTGTHFFFIRSSNTNVENGIYQGYYDQKPIASIGGYEVFPTNYAVLKEASLIAGTENILGVGPGANNAFLQQLKSEGRFPLYFENFDPHSIYTGTFGDLGILGLLALLWVMYEVYRALNRIQKTNNYLAIGLFACFIFFALEGIILDILNFRHLWILLGVLAFMHQKTVGGSKTAP